jgi:molecular chaperone DnaK (HSP70)
MISSLILKRLKLAAEEFLQHPMNRAVITVPAFYSETQRAVTQEAVTLARLVDIRLLNEPTAAAMAYSLRKKTSLSSTICQKSVDLAKLEIIHDATLEETSLIPEKDCKFLQSENPHR